MKNKMKRFLGILLSLALVLGLGLVPGLELTARAEYVTPLSALERTGTVVRFNNMDWYILKNDFNAESTGTITLLSKDFIGQTQFNTSEGSMTSD